MNIMGPLHKHRLTQHGINPHQTVTSPNFKRSYWCFFSKILFYTGEFQDIEMDISGSKETHFRLVLNMFLFAMAKKRPKQLTTCSLQANEPLEIGLPNTKFNFVVALFEIGIYEECLEKLIIGSPQ